MRSWRVTTSMFSTIAVWKLNKTCCLLFVFLLWNLAHTVHMNLELITSVTPYGSNLLTCRSKGTRNVTFVGWYIGSNSNQPLILEPRALDAECNIFSNRPPSFEGYKINYTCDGAKNIYTLEIKPQTPRDDVVLMICAIVEPPPREESNITISFNESTTTATTPESTTTATTPESTTTATKPVDDQSNELRLGLGLGLGIGGFGIIIFVFIMIVILCKAKVIIENKDKLQSPPSAEKQVTIIAKIDGCWISSVEWIKEQKILPNDENYKIIPYNGKTKKSSLTIKKVSKTENETYICRAKGLFGSSAQGSITIPPGKKKTRKKKTGQPSKTQNNRSAPCKSKVQSTEKEENLVEKPKQKRKKTKKNGQMSDGNPEKEIEETERHPGVHIGTQNKLESNTTSRQRNTSDEHQHSPPLRRVAKDTPMPPFPKITDMKDQIPRRVFAVPDGMQDMVTETHRSIRPRLDQLSVQSNLKEEVSSEEPRKKRKKKRKRDQMNVTKNEVKMEELANSRSSLEKLMAGEA